METITLFKNKKDCCACGACLNICPKQAIKMQEDENGFLYPIIDNNKCIKCGLCVKTCALQNSKLTNTPLKTYAAQSNNTDLKKSASGGIFASLAINEIKAGGVVYGAALENVNGKLICRHIAVNNVTDLEKLQGSKYIQSNIGNIYQDVKKNLLEDKTILFTGTPCQVDGLRAYLGKKYENLYCIDIVCHGVPSNKMFQDYIETLEKKYNDKIIDFKFRDKTKGWGLTAKGYTAKGYTAKGYTAIISANVSSFYYYFLKSYIYRDSCYSCKYACKNRCGDITIGDYWGIETAHPEVLNNNTELDYKSGISCLIVNTYQGNKLIEKYKDDLRLIESDFEKSAKENGQLNRFSILNAEKRNEILNLYSKNGYKGVEDSFKRIRILNRLKNFVPIFLKKWIKQNIINKY